MRKTCLWVATLLFGTPLVMTTAGGALQNPTRLPKYAVDVSWPRPLPDRWVLGGIGGVCVDHRDHVLILNRQDVLPGDLNAGHLAPSIIEFDAEGTVVNSWGDPDILDARLHSCFFDHDNNVWIASAPSGMVQKFSHDGKSLLFQVGRKGVFDSSDGTVKGTPLNSNTARFFMPSSLYVDPKSGDLYVADGESGGGNRRVAVIDAKGNFVRQWQPESARTVHCMSVANDGLVYVCNRAEGRLQVYDKAGTFLRNIAIPWTPYTRPSTGKLPDGGGAAVSLELSRDPAQRFMYLINQESAEVEVLDRREEKIVDRFGGGVGHYPGQFDQPHGIAVDSQGNVYVAENRGRRVQKFRPAPE